MSEQTLEGELILKDEDQWPMLYKENGLQRFMDEIKEKGLTREVPDVETEKGRERIGSLAREMSSSKTAVEKPGRDYLRIMKAKIKPAEAEIKRFVDYCDAERDKILAPRKEWEQKKADQVAEHKAKMEELSDFLTFDYSMPAAGIKVFLADLLTKEPDESFEEYTAPALKIWKDARAKIQTALDTRIKYESEQAELERLRAEQAEREQKEREDRIAADAAENETTRHIQTYLNYHNDMLESDEGWPVKPVYFKEKLAELEALKPEPEMEKALAAWDVSIEHIKGHLDTSEKRQKGLAEKAEAQRIDYYQRMLQHIRNCGLGMIDNKSYPYAVLLRELEEKIVINSEWGEFEQEAIKLRDETLKALLDAQKKDAKAAKDREQKRIDDEIESKRLADEEATKKREQNKKHHAKINNQAISDLEDCVPSLDRDQAKEIVVAIARKLIANVTIQY